VKTSTQHGSIMNHTHIEPSGDDRDIADDLTYDVAIVGAGPVGLALAGWLGRRSGTRALRVALIDARSPAAQHDDPRALAVSHGSRVLLEPLHWPADATSIERIHVSQRGHFGRTVIDREEHGLAALGYVVRYGALTRALGDALLSAPHAHRCDWLTSTRAGPPEQDTEYVYLPLFAAPAGMNASRTPDAGDIGEARQTRDTPDAADIGDARETHERRDTPDTHDAPRRVLRARVAINAEGGTYRGTSAADGAPTLRAPGLSALHRAKRDYGQTALVGVVTLSAPQPHVAWERFTSEGPIALLPLGGPRQADYALVWCCDHDEAARRAQLPDEALLEELGHAFGKRMGRFEKIAGRAAFPLGLSALDALADGRVAAIGNAAQTLHPVAGQGLNLGLRDAHALVEALGQHGPSPEALRAFAQRRTLDRRITIAATDTLARAFTLDFAPLATLRGLALAALEFVPPAKSALARQMMFGQRR
jgi:2-octaprenyl-6-methoxyphenol hydroxylase